MTQTLPPRRQILWGSPVKPLIGSTLDEADTSPLWRVLEWDCHTFGLINDVGQIANGAVLEALFDTCTVKKHSFRNHWNGKNEIWWTAAFRDLHVEGCQRGDAIEALRKSMKSVGTVTGRSYCR